MVKKITISLMLIMLFMKVITANIVHLGAVHTKEDTDLRVCQDKSDGTSCICDNKTVGSCQDGVCENCVEDKN